MTLKHWLMLILIGAGAFAYQYPDTAMDLAHDAGIGSGTACGSLENYLVAAGNDDLSEASKYKFAGDPIPNWIDNLDSVDSVSCTCEERIGDRPAEKIRDVADIPDQVGNLTTTKLILFELEGTFNGEDATMEGGAVVFQPVTPGWFVTQEGFYRLNGEDRDGINIGELSQECSV